MGEMLDNKVLSNIEICDCRNSHDLISSRIHC
jgi:hypothetical protein